MAASGRAIPHGGVLPALILQALRFGAVGVVNTLIGLSCIYALMYFLHASAGAANAAGYVLGLGVSFILNRIWTFSSGQAIQQVLPKYVAAAIGCYFINLGLLLASTKALALNPYLAQLFGIGAYTICMFIACRWFVFAPASIGPELSRITD